MVIINNQHQVKMISIYLSIYLSIILI